METPAPYWIVIAWATMEGIELTGRYTDRLQQVRETRAAPLARALVWRSGNDNTPNDVRMAKAMAKGNGYTVYCYDEHEANPLEKARSAALATLAAVR